MAMKGIERSHAQSGFTVAEVVLVLVIMSIIAAIAFPRYANSMANHRADLAAARIAADLELARKHAKFNSTGQRCGFDVGADYYRLQGMSDPDHPAQEYIVWLSEEPYGADIVATDLGGDGAIIFNGFGLPDSGGSVDLAVGDKYRRIAIDPATGETTVSVIGSGEVIIEGGGEGEGEGQSEV
jgi:prepilin-type N-terminal cleavage/methylation domain-containing protein